MHKIAPKYREMREKAGMTAQEAATAFGVSITTLLNWEKFETSPNALNLADMATAYGCTVDELLGL